ncbi:MAG: leucine-rich repeat domain-containing protein [Candidatus Cyclobacteriaceae bacterium M2_1C_046]
MKISSITILLLLVLFTFPVNGQQKSTFSQEDLERYKEKARELTGFYFYLLNTLASKETGAREKEIIVTESYKKYFKDGKVQVEDDLAVNREVPTNKDIDAYLKDVDFFFKNARFDYEIEDVTQEVTEAGNPYIKVELTRRLSGITVEGDTLNNTQKRFIEFNISEKEDELLIASIYTTKLSEKEDLVNWWQELSFGWQEILKNEAQINDDSLTYDQIKEIVALKEINIRENLVINTLDPLSKLTELEQLDMAHTRITDLSPLRNLTKITFLNATNSQVEDLEALRYFFKLKSLLLDETQVDSIGVLENLTNLKILSLKHLPINNLDPLKPLKNLEELYLINTSISSIEPVNETSSLQVLDISYTPVKSLPPLNEMKNLKVLDISHTDVDDIQPVSNLNNLEEIHFDSTSIDSLDALEDINSLKRIYSDDAGISRQEAAAFMQRNPGTLVIFASDRLFEWWKNLSPDWKKALLKHNVFVNKTAPSKEELAALTRIDSLNLSNFGLYDLEPLNSFHQLFYLDISKNNISNIELLRNFEELKKVNISSNPVDTISALNQLKDLEEVKINNLNIGSLAPFYGLQELKIIFADHTDLDDETVREYEIEHPGVVIIYKTDELKEWWSALDDRWHEIFKVNLSSAFNSTKIDLHRILFLDRFIVDNEPISTLEPLSILLSPKEIYLSQLNISDLSFISDFERLETLKVTQMPINDLSPIANLQNLKNLNISDTPVRNPEPLAYLSQLEQLNISSTQVKNIKPIKCLENLRGLNIANTRVKRLKPLYNLAQLEELIIYNTKVSSREVRKFQENLTDVKVVYYR